MARLVLSEIGESPASIELQDIGERIWFDVVSGGRWDLPSVRGENLVYDGTPGQEPMADIDDWFVADELQVRLHGVVEGLGLSAATRRAAFAEIMDDLNAVLGHVGKVVRLTAHPPNEALATGETATIDLQLVRRVSGPVRGWQEQEMDLDFRCVSDEPEWTINEAS